MLVFVACVVLVLLCGVNGVGGVAGDGCVDGVLPQWIMILTLVLPVVVLLVLLCGV